MKVLICFDEAKAFGFKAGPLHERDRLNDLSNLEADATKTINFFLNRSCEQARQSNSKGGSPAEPLILHNIHDLGLLKNVKAFGRVNGEPFEFVFDVV